MHRQKLILFKNIDNYFHTVFKTRHGRLIYLKITIAEGACRITDCYYLDRIRSGKYYAAPLKLKTLSFQYNDTLAVIAEELDCRFYGIEFVYSETNYDTENFIQNKLAEMQSKYKFLIFIGEGELIDGIPSVIKTRFKNRIHRSIYIEMQYRNGKGVITNCHYYDRKYKERSTVVPEMLSTVFFEYKRQAILNMINNELNTAFTHIIFVNDGSLNIDNEAALCGNV